MIAFQNIIRRHKMNKNKRFLIVVASMVAVLLIVSNFV